MSSLHRQPGRPHWFCAFTTPDGKRHFKSTGTTDKSQARQVCTLWESAANMARTGKLTVDKARSIIARGVADVVAAGGESLPSSTISDFLNSWLERKLLEAGERTHVRYERVVEQFTEFLGAKANRDIAQLVSKEIAGFRDSLAKQLTVGTTNTALKIIRSALNQAKRDGLVDVNEAERVTLLKRRKAFERRPFTLAELKRVLEAANEEWRGMILVGLYTGLRLGDVATLTFANVDLQRRELVLTTEKTGRRQITPLAKPLLQHMENLPASDDPNQPLFPNAYAARQRNPVGGPLSNQFYSILVSAGLAKPRPHRATKKGRRAKRDLGGLSFHCLRHTSTSLLKNAGVSDSIVMDLIGHDSKLISANYSHIDQDTKRAALDKLPDVTG